MPPKKTIIPQDKIDEARYLYSEKGYNMKQLMKSTGLNYLQCVEALGDIYQPNQRRPPAPKEQNEGFFDEDEYAKNNII